MCVFASNPLKKTFPIFLTVHAQNLIHFLIVLTIDRTRCLHAFVQSLNMNLAKNCAAIKREIWKGIRSKFIYDEKFPCKVHIHKPFQPNINSEYGYFRQRAMRVN